MNVSKDFCHYLTLIILFSGIFKLLFLILSLSKSACNDKHTIIATPISTPNFALILVNPQNLSRSDHVRLLMSIPTFHKQIEATFKAVKQWSDVPSSKNARTKQIDGVVFFLKQPGHDTATYRKQPILSNIRRFCATSQWVDMTITTAFQFTYPTSTYVQFLNIVHLAHNSGYEALLQAEPDLFVLRPFWVDAILSILKSEGTWWVRGSAWYDQTGSWSQKRRTNGNAVYNVADTRFLNFINTHLRAPFLIYGFAVQLKGFDDNLFDSMTEVLENCPSERWMSPLISYTSMIANLGYMCNVFNATSAGNKYPNAYLAHISGGCERQ